MDDSKRLDAVKKFFTDWNGRGSEKSDAQLFWNDFIRALGVEQTNNFIRFEVPIDVDGHECFIDGLISSTKVLIEQKSKGIDLDKPARQSDGKFLTPFDQAKRYADALPYSQHPRWIIVCNFDEFRIYDMDRLTSTIDEIRDAFKPQIINFNHLTLEYKRLGFVVDPNDENIDEVRLSKDAVRIIKRIRDAFARKMIAPRRVKNEPVNHLTADQRDMLNKFCVRLVFCLFAEDADIFHGNQFIDYVKKFAARSDALKNLFTVLNQPRDQRDSNLGDELNAFPYVDGDLFDESALELPPFDSAIADGIVLQARGAEQKFNWFTIDPTIFGALFESTLNSSTRRTGVMHYTSRANIHKLIDPLFMDELGDEFDAIKRKTKKNRRRALEEFQDKIASLIFFDPACGSGNFLTETYISLRQLENKIIDELINLGAPCTIKVSIDQFYGIEINGFAAAIARTAMWISENKLLYDTNVHVGVRAREEYLPLKHSARIFCDNALKIDWASVVPDGADYIIGNPPFSGARYMTADNKADLLRVFKGWTHPENLDFVSCWFKKATDFIIGSDTRAAFIATNSICQGESIGLLWTRLLNDIHIDFAHRTFKWTHDRDDPDETAAVYCVIIGFSVAPNKRPKLIYDGEKKFIATNINAYLMDGENFFVEARNAPLCDVPAMNFGNQPRDGGNLIIEADDYDRFVRREPCAKKFIRRLIGAEEFLYGKDRYCLWLTDATDEELKLPLIAKRIDAVRRFRLKSRAKTTRGYAKVPHRFAQVTQPAGKNYILVPSVSSGARKYIPIGFMTADVISSNAVQIIPDGELFHFGVLESSVHMAWTRTIAGYLGTSYRYSLTIVYNNFVWCDRSARIEETAQKILDVRARYPDRTLASLYNEDSMPDDLRAAHVENDHAVLDAYGFDRSMSESEIVSRLMDMYQRLTQQKS